MIVRSASDLVTPAAFARASTFRMRDAGKRRL